MWKKPLWPSPWWDISPDLTLKTQDTVRSQSWPTCWPGDMKTNISCCKCLIYKNILYIYILPNTFKSWCLTWFLFKGCQFTHPYHPLLRVSRTAPRFFQVLVWKVRTPFTASRWNANILRGVEGEWVVKSYSLSTSHLQNMFKNYPPNKSQESHLT